MRLESGAHAIFSGGVHPQADGHHHQQCHKAFRLFEIEGGASIMASATLYSLVYPTARRGGLRGAGGISTDAKMAANIDRGF